MKNIFIKILLIVALFISNSAFAEEITNENKRSVVPLNQQKIQLLNYAQDYLAKVKTIKASFVQINPGTNILSSGKIIISKPGRLKMSYIEPYKIDYYINDDDLTQYDHDLDEVTRADAPENPLKVLLYDNLTLSNNDIMQVTNIEDQGATFSIYLLNKAETIRDISGLILKFKKMPIELISIGRVDYQGNNTQTNFSSIKINEKIEDKEFIFKRPKALFPSSR